MEEENEDRFPPTSRDTVAVLHFLGQIHVLPPLKQHLPPFLKPITLLEHPTAVDGLCRHHGHDHHLTATDLHQQNNGDGVFTFVTLLVPSLSSGKFQAFWAMLFSSMGFFSIVPAIHAHIVTGAIPSARSRLLMSRPWQCINYRWQFLYFSRILESLKAGWFNLAGHSHQMFHVFVIMGALAHYGATLLLLQW